MAVDIVGHIMSDIICETGMLGFSDTKRLGGGLKLNKSTTVLDVGAGLGYFTLMFANAGHLVETFESVPRHVMLIRASLCQNPSLSQSVTLHHVALTASGEDTSRDKDDYLSFYQQQCVDGEGHAGKQLTLPPHVPISTLDAVLHPPNSSKSLEDIFFMRVDVGRYSCEVLLGGLKIFNTHRPQYVMSKAWSDNEESGCKPQEYIDLFQERGYFINHWGFHSIQSLDSSPYQGDSVFGVDFELYAAQVPVPTAAHLLQGGPSQVVWGSSELDGLEGLAVLVETRHNDKLHVVLEHFVKKLRRWGFIIFHSERNAAACQRVARLFSRVSAKKLEDAEELHSRRGPYSRLLTTHLFWMEIPHEHILIFHLDSWICAWSGDLLRFFFEFAMIGAFNGCSGGNGGLSLRRRSWMLRATSPDRFNPSEQPEDVVFSERLEALGAPLAKPQYQHEFSIENEGGPPMGLQPWACHQAGCLAYTQCGWPFSDLRRL